MGGILSDLWEANRADKKAKQSESLMERLYGSPGQAAATTYGATMQPTTETTRPDGSIALTGGQQMQGPGQGVSMQGQSGLLGGQMTQPQFNAQMQSGLAGIYGAEGLMQEQAIQQMRGQQAMQRQQQTQGYNAQNMSAYQAAQVKQQKANALTQLSNNNFDNMIKLQGRYDDEIAPYETTIKAAKDLDNMVKQNGYENAASQQFIISKALTTIRPGEAQMEGDVRNLARSAGFSGQMSDAWAWLTTNAANNPEILKGLHRMVRTQAMIDQRSVNSTREKIQKAYRLSPQAMKVMTWGDATADDQYAVPLMPNDLEDY